MAELLQLKQKRARVKGQITRIQSFFEANQNCSAAEAQVRLKKVEDLWAAFEDIQEVLESTSLKDEKQSEQFQRDNETERVVFEERYYLVAAQAQHIIDTARQPQGTQQQPNNLQNEGTSPSSRRSSFQNSTGNTRNGSSLRTALKRRYTTTQIYQVRKNINIS